MDATPLEQVAAEAQVPFEQTLASIQPSTVSAEDIRCYVNANLSRLERFVERELYFREAAEQMIPDAVTKDEVIDEVIAGALGDGGDKPDKMALEPWLYRLAIHAIGDLQARSSDNVVVRSPRRVGANAECAGQ